MRKNHVEALIGPFAAGARMILPSGAVLDCAGIVALHRALTLASSDWHCDIIQAVRTGEMLVAELYWSGTHDGMFHTGVSFLMPTGARVSFRSRDVFTLYRGEIVEWRCNFDPVALFRQMVAPLMR